MMCGSLELPLPLEAEAGKSRADMGERGSGM